jgi:hypothetical protein
MATTKNSTGLKILDKLASDPRVCEIRREGDDGYFVDLAPGFNFEGQCSIRADRAIDLTALMRLVTSGEPY